MSGLIFGRQWEVIQQMQQKQPRRTISVPLEPLPMATDADRELFREHGFDGLEAMKFYGVIDRLRNSGVI
jgi:hypothetical protein